MTEARTNHETPARMRILLATDAWEPQVNGVVRTLTRTVAECRAMGHEVLVISPDQFKTIPMPTYPEIRLALGAYEEIREKFKQFEPDGIHIATEGPIGMAARRLCIEWKLPFTTSYHTKYPEYIAARFPVPLSVGYAFHEKHTVELYLAESFTFRVLEPAAAVHLTHG